MNLILLCHGGLLDEGSGFQILQNQTVTYRGNYGTALGYDAANHLVKLLLSQYDISDDQIRMTIPNYAGSVNMPGPAYRTPDIGLGGDDKLPCLVINMANRRYVRLGSDWDTRLKLLLRDYAALFNDNGGLWLNLLCCTESEGTGLTPPKVDQEYLEKHFGYGFTYTRVDTFPELH